MRRTGPRRDCCSCARCAIGSGYKCYFRCAGGHRHTRQPQHTATAAPALLRRRHVNSRGHWSRCLLGCGVWRVVGRVYDSGRPVARVIVEQRDRRPRASDGVSRAGVSVAWHAPASCGLGRFVGCVHYCDGYALPRIVVTVPAAMSLRTPMQGYAVWETARFNSFFGRTVGGSRQLCHFLRLWFSLGVLVSAAGMVVSVVALPVMLARR